ncbi:MAG: hypothetical protein R3C49_09365 [Planctomycetaceae bacterium]
MPRSRFKLILLITSTLWVTAGCGGSNRPETVSVTGTVTFDGTPLISGDVILRAIDKTGNSYAGKIADGTFVLEADPGRKQVEIVSYQQIPGKMREDNPGELVPVTEQIIPAEFNEKSDLVAVIEPNGENFLTFDLESPPRKKR